MKRGEIWWADLGRPTGSGRGMRRPVVVVQSNPFNNSRINTLIAVVVTSNLSLELAPGNVRLSKRDSGLRKPSVANVSQVITVDCVILTQRAGTLPQPTLALVDQGLRLALAL